MTNEQRERKAMVNIELDGDLFDKTEMVMQSFDWSRANAVRNIMRRGLDLPTPMDRAPNAELDGEGN